jgi:hypothetical protein
VRGGMNLAPFRSAPAATGLALSGAAG